MARTFVRQDTQIRNSDLYDDTLGTGVTLESGAANIEDDLNGLRSQVEKIIDNAGNWWDPLKGRSLGDTDTDLDLLENRKILCGVQILTDVTVPASQNYVVLSAAGSETPTSTAGIAGGVGAVVAVLGTDVGSHGLDAIAGSSAIRPLNLVVIRDAVSKDSITSGGMEVYGLLQAETGVVQGDTFDDATKQTQISFVRDDGSDGLEAVPFADVENKVIEYLHQTRVTLETLPEDCGFPNIRFTDRTNALDVTLDVAIDNQGATPATQDTDITITQGTGVSWCWEDALNADFFCLEEGSAGGTTRVHVLADTDLFDVDAVDNDFLNGVSMNSGGTRPIDVGVTDGVIESTAGDLFIKGAAELLFDDVNQNGSTWAQDGIKLSDTTAEWDNYEAIFGGEVSLLNAIVQATTRLRSKIYANVTVTTTEDIDVGGAAGGANLDAQLPDMSGGTFLTDYDTFVNGDLVRPAAVLNTNDYYPGTSLPLGQLKFDFTVKIGDVICVIPYA